MTTELSTIYRAKNLQEAYLLRNSLEEEGIRATIANEVLQGGSGVDVLGWATLAQVQVADEDAVRAREIAMQFDRDVSGRAGKERATWEGKPLGTAVVDAWPCCPQCGNRRLTRCTFCGTAGTDFPPADSNTGDLLGLPTPAADAVSGFSCGPGGCGVHQAESSDARSADEKDDFAHSADSSPESASTTLLLCPTCDEPFQPQYLRRCEWCGHEFPDGIENPTPEERVQEPINWRIAYVIYVLALLAIGLGVYLLWLF